MQHPRFHTAFQIDSEASCKGMEEEPRDGGHVLRSGCLDPMAILVRWAEQRIYLMAHLLLTGPSDWAQRSICCRFVLDVRLGNVRMTVFCSKELLTARQEAATRPAVAVEGVCSFPAGSWTCFNTPLRIGRLTGGWGSCPARPRARRRCQIGLLSSCSARTSRLHKTKTA